MKYLSLFSGIGGFELGIGNKHECIGFSEIDKYAISIYKKHFPNHKNYESITTINESALPDFDLLCGGFPCQAFSIAGKRGGFSDTRGTLFFDIARILQAKQPRLLFLENVKGLLSHDNGQTFAVIISTLTELGYDIQWQVLNSKNFGVPQNRERVFIVGHLRGTPRPKVFPFGENNQRISDQSISVQSKVRSQDKKDKKCEHDNSEICENGDNRQLHIGTLRTHKDGRGFREIKSGLSPTIPARAREDGSGQPVIRIPEATKKGYAEATVGQSINLSVMGSKTRRGRVSNVAQTLDTGMQQHTLTSEMRIRRLTPRECERLQGFPDLWTTWGIVPTDELNRSLEPIYQKVKISDTQRYKTLGNAVTVNVIRAIAEKIL